MAGTGGDIGSRKEELLQEANNIGDILKKINSPREKYADGGNRGGGRGGGGRGGICSDMGKDRGRWRQRGGGHGRGRGIGRGQNRDFKHLQHTMSPQHLFVQKPNEQTYLQDDWGYGEPYQRRQETGRDPWQDVREVGDTLGGQGGARRYHRNNSDNREQVGLNKDRQVVPHQLVKALIGQPTFSASLLQLMEQQQLTPAAVQATVSRYDLVFCLDGEDVQLRPQLDICAAHCGPGGCQDRTSCTNLHICPKMAVDKCDAGQDCVMGHHWHTNHNLKVLKSLYLESFQHHILAELLQFLYGSDQNQSQDPTNESPRDIMAMLLEANHSLNQTLNQPIETKETLTATVIPNNHKENSSMKDSSEVKKQSVNGNQSSEENSENNDVSADGNETKPTKNYESNIDTSNFSSKKMNDKSEHLRNKDNCNITNPTHYLQGDVETLAITNKDVGKKGSAFYGPIGVLMFSIILIFLFYHPVEDLCKSEGTGCSLLHASQHFHWQVRQKSGHWMNLRLNQVTCIERAFCDPNQNGVDLPRLDPATFEMSVSGLLILMGRDDWHADFPDNQKFTLTNLAKPMTLELRRLCTQTLNGQPTAPSKYAWYFLDGNQKWVKYGNVDTLGNAHKVSNITSEDIEKHFEQSPTQLFSFKNSEFTYSLNLQTMKQTNQHTNVHRSVRRRPEPHLPNEQEGSEQTKASSDLPAHWESMQSQERIRILTLAPTSSEYKTAVALLGRRVSESNVLKVERIQNPFLWRAFQNKVKELTAVYNHASKVDVRQLFHGTSPKVIASICAENLDWRLHGSAFGHDYGQGTYFSTDAAYSYNYCQEDHNGFKYMFIVKVAVGSMVEGNSGMVRPPNNPATSLPYDSTTNSDASIIVKYDKQEYYPEFVLTLQ